MSGPADDVAPTLSAESIHKTFGRIRAVDGIDVEVHAGEVLALVGDNGAGKSTLMKILTGVLTADSGAVYLHGKPISMKTPLEAREHGIAAVFQDHALVECLDIASNLFLGETPKRRFMVDRRLMDSEALHVLNTMSVVAHSPRTPVGLLPAGHRQIIAIARALRRDAPVIVMDEPTAALGVREKGQVAGIIDHLKAQRRAVMIVSHDLDLVFNHADRIQVMRLGRTAGIRTRRQTDRDEIVGLITGARADHAERGLR